MRRVLTIATLYPNAQMQRFGTFVARQSEALAARDDWDVTVINPIGIPPLKFGRYKSLANVAVSGAENGVAVYRPIFTLIPAIGGPFNPAMITRSAVKLARELHELAPFDLVDAQFFYPDGPAAARVAQELGLPLSIKARGADISLWGRKPYAIKKMEQAAEQASGLLSVSKMLARDMGSIGLPEDKITVHYTGLDHSLFHPLDHAQSRRQIAQDHGIKLEDSDTLLASVGALIPRKGQEFAIRALPKLPRTHLALVGNGPDRAMLEALGVELDVRQRVHFLGSLNHNALPHVLSAADAMVLPTQSEGLANAWVEALACGTPLLTTDVGGARELLTEEFPEAGRFITRDADSIVAGAQAIFAANVAPEEIAQCAARFSWEANAAALAEYYEGLISK